MQREPQPSDYWPDPDGRRYREAVTRWMIWQWKLRNPMPPEPTEEST